MTDAAGSDSRKPDSEPIASALPNGTVVAERYRIERVLGEGASGIVYLAEATATAAEGDSTQIRAGQRVALKLIHRHLARDPQVSKRFDREARILRKLRGTNLIALLDFGATRDGLLYMALEHVEGRPLDAILSDGPLPPDRAATIVKQVCCALEVAHAADVIHRDLKPSNVIIAADERGADHAYVLDFGLAKMLRGDLTQSMAALTQQGMVFGTPAYMAPEQARGDDVDARADLYAAGIILYELLTGDVPFSGKNPIAVMTAHLMEAPERPAERAPDAGITPALEAVVLHALAKRPEDRYASATALATALSSALSRPRDVASTAPPPPDEDFATRDTELSLQADPARFAPPDAAPTARRTPGWVVVALLAALVGIVAGLALSMR